MSSMFWKLSFRQPSAIDTLLDREDCTLSEILDEDDVLQECKAQNKKLIDFLSRPEILEELIGLIAREANEDAEDKVKYKYPHIACELLTSEVFAIVEQLSGSEHLMGLLWTFLDSSESLNPLVGSFISKVLAMLLNQKATVIFDFMQTKDGFLTHFLNHLGTSAMMDLLLQMVATPDTDQSRLDLAVWLKDQGVVERLIDFIRPTVDPEQCGNASQAVCDMIRLSREAAQMASPAPLLAILESEEIMQRLLDNMFCSETPSDSVIVNGIAVILTILEKSKPPNILTPTTTNSFGGAEENLSATGNTEIVEQLLTIVLPRVKDFHNLLTRRPSMAPMVTTVGTLDPPLGNTRLQVVKLFSSLLHCNESRISAEIARLKTFSVLMELFFQFPWNNFLHTQVESCVSAAIFSQPPPRNGGQQREEGSGGNAQEENVVSLRHHLFTDCRMVHMLLKGEELNNSSCSRDGGGRRQGYMGHLIRITNTLVQCREGDEQLRAAMEQALDEDTQQRWNDFISGSLADMNKKNETNLGGSRPVVSSMDDSDEELDQLFGGPDSELEKMYQVYQDVKYISPMVDDYGVDDVLNPMEEPFASTFTRLMELSNNVNAEEEQSQAAAQFENACSDRIKQFDDSDSDEEESSTWAEKEVAFISPMDQQSSHSLSSDDDEDFERQREFPTGSSDDQDRDHLSKRAAAYIATASTHSDEAKQHQHELDKMEIDAMNVPWRTEVSADEDLSRVVPMDTGGNIADWTKEPEPMVSSPASNWADFSTFGQTDNTTPQDMDLEPALEPGDITVTYTTSEETNRLATSEDSPERQGSSHYTPLSPITSSSGDEEQPSSSTLDPSGIEVSLPHDSETSSEEEDRTSSDSDEERSGIYHPNVSAGSDSELLINSPAQPQPKEETQPTPTDTDAGTLSQDHLTKNSSPTTHDPSANGVQVSPTAVTLTASHHPRNEKRDTECTGTDGHLDSIGLNAINPSEPHMATSASGGGDERVNENSEPIVDGEIAADELQDNFSFLSRQGLLSEGPSQRSSKFSDELTDEQRLIEEKRAEAKEACAQWEQVSQKPQDRVET